MANSTRSHVSQVIRDRAGTGRQGKTAMSILQCSGVSVIFIFQIKSQGHECGLAGRMALLLSANDAETTDCELKLSAL